MPSHAGLVGLLVSVPEHAYCVAEHPWAHSVLAYFVWGISALCGPVPKRREKGEKQRKVVDVWFL